MASAEATIGLLLRDKSVEDVICISPNLHYILSSAPSKKVSEISDPNFLIISPIKILHDPEIFKKIIGHGKSLKTKKKLSAQLGIERYSSFEYSLANLEPTKKQTFSHALYGTGGRENFLKKISGMKSGKNNVLIPVDKTAEITAFFDVWDVKYEKKSIWLEKEQRK